MDSLVHEATKRKGKFLGRERVVEQDCHMLRDCQGDNWNDLLKEIITFNSVEEFWGVYVCTTVSQICSRI